MFARPTGCVTLLSDFGLSDPYVGLLKGALLRASPKVQVIDLCHGVPPHQVAAGAFVWGAAVARFPAGTVHVGVVDPGVGTTRRLLAVAAEQCYWIGPDNGLVSRVLQTAGEAEVRAIDVEHLGLSAESRTFHGRDLMAPVAAWLASGRYGFTALGPRISDPALLAPSAATPHVLWVDHYGNLVSNVLAAALDGVRGVVVGAQQVPLVGTYQDVAAGALLAYVGSFGLLEIAQNQGSAAATLGAGTGATIRLLRP